MPLYEYECSACRTRFEVRQRVADDPITVCPSCGGETRRVFHPVGIIFKGSGWYITDSRGSDASTSAKSDHKATADDSASKKDSAASSSAESPSKSTADAAS